MEKEEPSLSSRFRITPYGAHLLADILIERHPSLPTAGDVSWFSASVKAVSFYSRFVKPGDLCFDFGANVGNRVAVFRILGARVIAVEPQGESVQALERKYASDDMVTIVHAAVGEVETTRPLYVSSDSVQTSLHQHWFEEHPEPGPRLLREDIVKVTTAKRLIEEYGWPDFTKIDVEGYESNVIDGLPGQIGPLSIEFHTHAIEVAQSNVSKLKSLGYDQFNISIEESYGLDFDKWVSADELTSLLKTNYEGYYWYGDIYARIGSG